MIRNPRKVRKVQEEWRAYIVPWEMTIEDSKLDAEMAIEDDKSETGTMVEGAVASCLVRTRLCQGKDDGDTVDDGGTTS